MSVIESRTDASDPAAFKATFGRFATGVSVVTCAPDGGTAIGVTINSLSSVSLDPALAMFCLEDRSVTLKSFLSAGHFALNILAEDQSDMSNRFAVDHDIRADDQAATWISGAPILPKSLAVADCVLLDTFGGGDHVTLLGRVLEVGNRPKASPLLYYCGKYGRFIE